MGEAVLTHILSKVALLLRETVVNIENVASSVDDAGTVLTGPAALVCLSKSGGSNFASP
jgi:hypothetical protein